MNRLSSVSIGTAGWTLPKDCRSSFAEEGTHLQRYASTLNCVEVNSSFHRPHRRATWERWAASVPCGFRFAAKMPKSITHTAKLQNAGALLLPFFEEVNGLNASTEQKLGPVLVQLPPSFAYEEGVVHEFLSTVRELYNGSLIAEPRHASWFTGEADRLLRGFDVARVAADPPKGSPRAAEPGGSSALTYWRLHGAPRTYYSDYSDEFLQSFAERLRTDAEQTPERPTWVIFDNTALGHATRNALRLLALLSGT